MPTRIRNSGEARTVDFLAVFDKGETKEFSDDEIAAYEAMSGVPFAKGGNLPDGFKVVTKAQATEAQATEEVNK